MRTLIFASFLSLAALPAFAFDTPAAWDNGAWWNQSAPSASAKAAVAMGRALAQTTPAATSGQAVTVTPSGTAVARTCSLQVGGSTLPANRLGQPVINNTTVNTVIQVCN